MIPADEQWEQFHAESPRRCHHLTLRKARCPRPRISWPAELGVPDPHSCTTHLEVAERATLEEYKDRTDESRIWAREYERWATYDDPACWSWEPRDMSRWEAYRDNFPEVVRPTLSKEICLEGLMDGWHEDRCAICGRDGRGRLVTDHDHDTGWIRGLLCRSCNTKEGCTPGGIWEKYRQRNPASICGVKAVYVSPVYGPAVG